jgi:biotin carboxyl carrier protein
MDVRAEMVANVWKVLVEDGASVQAEQELLILESMKMEIPVVAPTAGVVSGLTVAAGAVVQEGDVLLSIAEPSAASSGQEGQ